MQSSITTPSTGLSIDGGYIRLSTLVQKIPVNKATIWRWVKAGKFIAPTVLNGIPMWSTQEVDTWIQAQKVAQS